MTQAQAQAQELPSAVLRRRLLHAMLPMAAERGWSHAALRSAALEIGLTEGECALAAPRGSIDVIDAFAARADDSMLAALAALEPAPTRIRERVTAAIWLRLMGLDENREAVRRSLPVLALPQNALDGARLGWRTADGIWRYLGDRSTDANYYSKRAILAGVHAATLAVWLADYTPGFARTRGFLEARIENVMQFEKLKGRFRANTPLGETLAGALGAMRYRWTGR